MARRHSGLHRPSRRAIVRKLHDDLNAAATDAYGWPAGLSAPAIVARVVALNAGRRSEVAAGQVRWLRPAYQAPAETARVTQTALAVTKAADTASLPPWPATEADRYVALRSLLASTPRRPHPLFQARTNCESPRNARNPGRAGQARRDPDGLYRM